MANMIIYQQSFNASARMINAAQEMDQIILDLLR
jgi:flagellar hook-associated protein FlgK